MKGFIAYCSKVADVTAALKTINEEEMKVILMMFSKKLEDCKQNPMEQFHEQMKNDQT